MIKIRCLSTWRDKSVKLPHLRTLSVGFLSYAPDNSGRRTATFVFPFFSHLNLPTLEDLAIETSENPDCSDELIGTLAALCDRSGFNLKSFQLVNIATDAFELWTFHNNKAPELVFLHLETQSLEEYYTHLVNLRFQPSTECYPLPMLQKLAIVDDSRHMVLFGIHDQAVVERGGMSL